jgi:hypothetical protein
VGRRNRAIQIFRMVDDEFAIDGRSPGTALKAALREEQP